MGSGNERNLKLEVLVSYLITKLAIIQSEFESVFIPIAELPPTGVPSAHEMHNYLAQDDGGVGPRGLKDTQTIGSAYDRYLQHSVPF